MALTGARFTGIKIDAGSKVSDVMPETAALTRMAFEWLAHATNAVEGRDFFGKLRLEVSYEAGQVSLVRCSPEQTIQ